jgi:hypothetical protein
MSKTCSFRINREKAENIFNEFIKDDKLKVLALKGKWGVGKTHLVTTSLDSQKVVYYYSSAFGLSSIEQLKAQLLASNLLVGKFFEFNSKKSDKFSKIPIVKNYFSGAAISIVGDLLLDTMIASLKNSIFCIDDIERKSNIPLDELLGFIDYIITQTKSKVILIYNEEHLISSEDDKNFLDIYRERVFDVEILLNPEINENTILVFANDNDISIIQEILNKVQTNNIRILRKIKFILDKIRPNISKWHPSLRDQLIKNIIIFYAIKFDKPVAENLKINFEDIIDINNANKNPSFYLSNQNNDPKKFNESSASLRKLGWEYLKTDEQIIQFIESAFWDEKEFLAKGILLNKEENKRLKSRKTHEKYDNTFRSNESEIHTDIDSFFEEYHHDLTWHEIREKKELSKAVNFDILPYEKTVFEKLVTQSNSIGELKEIKLMAAEHPEIIQQADTKLAELLSNQSIDIIAREIILNCIVSPDNIEFLKSQTVDDYYQWLQKDNPCQTEVISDYLLREDSISKNIREAILRLASDSPLNALRAKKLYNITH